MDRVVLLHGFTQSSATWGPLARALRTRHDVLAVDLPGHGQAAGVESGLWGAADFVAAQGGTASYVGYSLGGRIALHLALAHPEKVERLVVVSAHGGISDPELRAARAAEDEELAQRVEREGVEEFVRWWLSRPMWAGLATTEAALETRLGGTAAGLASSLRLAGLGAQEPLWGRLGELKMPVLFVAGETDHRYVGQARDMADAVGPNAQVRLIAGAGHACHLEAPAAFLAAVGPFLDGAS